MANRFHSINYMP